jgi:hypothetical protein
MWQVHGHFHRGDGVLGGLIAIPDAQREAHILHTDAVDGQPALIALILRIFKRRHGGDKKSRCCGWQQREK